MEPCRVTAYQRQFALSVVFATFMGVYGVSAATLEAGEVFKSMPDHLHQWREAFYPVSEAVWKLLIPQEV